MKSNVGMLKEVVQPIGVGVSGSEDAAGSGQASVVFQVFLYVTLPGGSGVPGAWGPADATLGALGSADAALTDDGTTGTRNRKLGSNRRGIRTAGASLRVIPAVIG